MFINLLSETMRTNDIETIHCEGDADVLIAQTAVNMAAYKVTYVIAEDTEICKLSTN